MESRTHIRVAIPPSCGRKRYQRWLEIVQRRLLAFVAGADVRKAQVSPVRAGHTRRHGRLARHPRQQFRCRARARLPGSCGCRCDCPRGGRPRQASRTASPSAVPAILAAFTKPNASGTPLALITFRCVSAMPSQLMPCGRWSCTGMSSTVMATSNEAAAAKAGSSGRSDAGATPPLVSFSWHLVRVAG